MEPELNMKNVVSTQYLPGFGHVGTLRKATFVDYFGVPKWGPKTGPQENPSVACPRRLWGAPGATFGDPSDSVWGGWRAGGTECLFGGPQGEDNRRGSDNNISHA